MLRLSFFFTLLFFSKVSWAECVLELNEQSAVDQLVASITSTPLTNCQNLQRPIKREEARELVKTIANKQKLELASQGDNLTRYQVAKKLNRCEANTKDKALVINFEGTGAFAPKTADVMNRFARCAGASELGKYAHYEIKKIVDEVYGTKENWSALQAGPLNQLTMDGDLSQMNWVTFPSEETELLGDPSRVSSYSSFQSNLYPRGVAFALECYKKYMADAKQKNIKPKIIVQGHSSGSRSAVKFLERLNDFSPAHEVDLMLTIDPVKEAHLAVTEVLSQIAGNTNREIYNAIPFLDDVEIKPPNVWTRRQPQTLYKPSNVKRAVNFYQNVDKKGLNMSIKFGIHGSPIHDADLNVFISEGLSDDAHGLIAKHDKTIEQYQRELRRLQLLP